MQEINHVMEGDDPLGGEQGEVLLELMATKLSEMRAGLPPAAHEADLMTLAVCGQRVLSAGEVSTQGMLYTALALLRMLGGAYKAERDDPSLSSQDPHLIGLAVVHQLVKDLLADASDDTTTH